MQRNAVYYKDPATEGGQMNDHETFLELYTNTADCESRPQIAVPNVLYNNHLLTLVTMSALLLLKGQSRPSSLTCK